MCSDGVYDFTMCNPPFYASREEVAQSAEANGVGPHAVSVEVPSENPTQTNGVGNGRSARGLTLK